MIQNIGSKSLWLPIFLHVPIDDHHFDCTSKLQKKHLCETMVLFE